MPTNTLHHNKTLSDLNTDAKYAKDSRRWSRNGRNGETHSTSAWKDARRRYNRAVRKAAKLQLSRYQEHVPTQQELDEQYYTWEDDRYMEDMDWTLSRDERRFNAEVKGRMHLNEDQAWRDWNRDYDNRSLR